MPKDWQAVRRFGALAAVVSHAIIMAAALDEGFAMVVNIVSGQPWDSLYWSILLPESFALTFVVLMPTIYLVVFVVLASLDTWLGTLRGIRWIAFGIEAMVVGAVLLLQLFLDALAGGEKNQIYVLFGFSYPAAVYLAYSAFTSLPDKPAWLGRWWPRFLAGAIPTALTAILAAFIAWAPWWT